METSITLFDIQVGSGWIRLDQVENNFCGEVARCLTVAVKFLNFKKKGRGPAGIRTDNVIS